MNYYNNCNIISRTKVDKIRRKEYKMINKYNCNKICYNINTGYDESDEFFCSNCGIQLRGWYSIEQDPYDGDIKYDYEFNYCPNCGARIKRIE